MLTQGEINFLNKIPEDKIVNIFPYNPQLEKTAQEIIKRVKSAFPNLEIIYMGASALKISGQGDIDIYCLAKPQDFSQYLPGLTEIFGSPKSSKIDSIAWELERNNVPIELYLTDPSSEPMKRQIAIFKKLQSDSKLLLEYEKLKKSFSGKTFKEYQMNKYEFYHKMLGD